MRQDPFKILLVILIALGILISADLGLARIQLEQQNKQLELAVEYGEIQRLARWSGVPVTEMFRQVAEKGVTGVLFKEELLGDLGSQKVWLRSGAELLSEYDWSRLEAGQLETRATYVVTDNKETYGRLVQQLKIKAPGLETWEANGLYLVTSTLGPGELKNLGLGFDREGIAGATKEGLNILLQVQNWPQATPEDVGAVVAAALETEGLTALLFNDGVLPGYPRSLEALLQELGKSQVPLGVIEFFPQQGLTQLVQNLDKRAVRLHPIGEQEMPKLIPEKAIQRLTLAATERNNRILLTRLFFRPEVGNWAEYNLNYLEELCGALEEEGFRLGAAKPFGSLPTSRVKLFFLGVAVLAGGVLLLDKLLPSRWAWGCGLVGVLGWVGLLALGLVGPGRLMMALAAVIVFPTLSLISHLREEGAGLGGSLGLTIRTSLHSLVGAILMVGLLADISFMLKVDQFRGVKIAHIMPLVLLVLFCFLWQEKERWLTQLRSLFQAKISVGWAVLALFLGVALLVYVSRTGNESVAVSGLELELRSLLDRVLVVRPRTKEFLIGHPALLLFFYLGYRHKYLPLLILGAIGQISLVNTFAHVHTPILISVFRAFNGLWLGMVVGIIAILIYGGVVKLGEWVEHGS